jgi:hypothetical protein
MCSTVKCKVGKVKYVYEGKVLACVLVGRGDTLRMRP